MRMRKMIVCVICFLCITICARTQTREVTGRVTDSKSGSPLPGVTVNIKGTNNSSQTNSEGFFMVNTTSNAVLVFTFIGYKPFEARVGVNTTIPVTLEEDRAVLNEVIVTANSVKREARSLGYSTTTIKAEELTRGKDRSVLNSLQGKMAGVQITQSSGGVGSSTRIVFRGGTSITGNNQALIVVDGIPIDNSQIDENDNLNNQVDAGNRGNDINPEDIESVTALKGPAAAALYGSRASNGALIITTKNGKNLKGKKSEVILSSSYNFESIVKLPEYQNVYGQGGQKEPDLRENFSWGDKFDGSLRPWGQVVDGEQRVKPYVAQKNNVREFFDIGRAINNNVSLAQKNDRNSFYLSFNNTDQKGIMPGTEYKRNSVRLTGTSDISNKVYANATINYIRLNGDLTTQGQGPSPYDQILQTPRDIPILELKDYKNKFNDLNGNYGAYTVNPYYYLGEDSYTSVVDRILGSAQLGYKPVEWFDINLRVGTDVSNDKRKQIVSQRNITNPRNAGGGNKFDGSYAERTLMIREFTTDLIGTLTKKLTPGLTLTALVGHNIRQRNTEDQFSQINSLTIPGLYNLANSAQPPVSANKRTERRLYGVYSSVDLAWKNYLFLGITGRNDWSSTLPQGKNSFFYPSVNASFVFSDAFKLPDAISYGKIRASAAQVGNDADPYLLESVFLPGTVTDGFANSQVNFPLNAVPGFTQANQIGNPDLKPEKTTSYELGLEFGMFNNRLSFEGTVYSNRSENQIITVPIAFSSGYTTQTLNAGLITNKGVEILLRGTPVRTRNFSWEITGTFTKNENKVVRIYPGTTRLTLPGGFSGGALVAQEGQPYGSFFGAAFLRDPQGRVVVDGTTGYPVTDPESKIHGNIQPDYLAGIQNYFTYKGFSLSVLFDVRKGGVFFSRTKSLQEFVGTDPRTLLNDREPFVVPNSVIKTPDNKYVENTVKVQNAENYWTSFSSPRGMEQLVDASYIKLRELSLTYRLPTKWFVGTPFTGINVGLSGRNLFIWTPKENTYSDPEASSFGTGNTQGYEYGAIPSVRNYGVNVRLVF
jgi:TonB-linked SusC/RagA family outer membrane protein